MRCINKRSAAAAAPGSSVFGAPTCDLLIDNTPVQLYSLSKIFADLCRCECNCRAQQVRQVSIALPTGKRHALRYAAESCLYVNQHSFVSSDLQHQVKN